MAKNEYFEIMDTTNSHNKELVRKINYLFCDEHCAESRKQILFALAQRDAEEIADKYNIAILNMDDVDKWDRELLMGVCDDNDLQIIISFCYGDMDYRRNQKLEELRKLIHQYGRMEFKGDFSFCGDDWSGVEGYCNDTKLMGLSLDSEDKVVVSDVWQGDRYTNSERFIPDFELDRIIEYVKNQMSKQKWHIRVTASRTFEVIAANYEEALSLAEQEYDKEPINSGDIDGWCAV